MEQGVCKSKRMAMGSGPPHIALALADFNLDGYQDIFLIGPTFAQVFTAKCTNDPSAACTGTAGNAISDGLVVYLRRFEGEVIRG